MNISHENFRRLALYFRKGNGLPGVNLAQCNKGYGRQAMDLTAGY